LRVRRPIGRGCYGPRRRARPSAAQAHGPPHDAAVAEHVLGGHAQPGAGGDPSGKYAAHDPAHPRGGGEAQIDVAEERSRTPARRGAGAAAERNRATTATFGGAGLLHWRGT
jgi:hypothetical protein